MNGIYMGLLEDIESYKGKNGFGANLVISKKVGRKTKRLELRTNSEVIFRDLEERLDTNVVLIVETIQNNFGLRFGNILGVYSSIDEVKFDLGE